MTCTGGSSACGSASPRTGGWLAFFRDMTAGGLTGVQLVTSDAHAGLVAAIGETIPGPPGSGAARTTPRTGYPSPEASWPWVKTLLHSVFDQPDAAAVNAQFERVLDSRTEKFPAVVEPLRRF